MSEFGYCTIFLDYGNCHIIIDQLAGMKGDKRPWVFRLNVLFA
jgi:hypothetical protein